MNWLRQLPIKRRVTFVILLTCSTGLVLACAAMVILETRHFRSSVVRDSTVLADVLAKNSQAVLSFKDEDGATQMLQALEMEPNVVGACLYSSDDKLFANYSRSNSVAPLSKIRPNDGSYFDSRYLVVVRPVLLNEKRIGSVLLRIDLQALYNRLQFFVLIEVLVVLGSCGVAIVLAAPLQRTISQPIVSLTEAVRAMAEQKNYKVRLPERGRDETGSLTGAFNHLLVSIEERDTALQAANESLRHNEAQLQTIVANLNEGLVVSDLNGQILYFNRAALDLHGFANLDECRRQLSAFVDTFELSDVDDKKWPLDQWPLARVLRGEKVLNLEVKVRNLKLGWCRIFSYGGSLVRDPDGKPIMALVTMSDVTERKMAEIKVVEQLGRLALLNQITRATGERLDLHSIFQVVVRTLEDQLPVDFCCICQFHPERNSLAVAGVGVRSESFASELAMTPQEEVPVGENGLSRCIQGQLVYEPDVGESLHPFPQRLARAGLRGFVAAPLLVESQVFGVLMAARRQAESFTSGECEFLRQLSEQVALAAHQVQLHTALQQAYDDLRQTQQSVMQQERLRALGQMASGIAHDINNAISPVALYTESLLETEANLSPRARDYLTTIQHSIEDVAQTVARMREFYRQKETQLALMPVQLNSLVQQVIDLSRARWSDMPQQKGHCIELLTELAPDLPVIAGVESEIREALLNLVFNAVDAMPEGGNLAMRTRIWPSSPNASETIHNGCVAVEVADTGMGMDEDTRRRCLEPFFTTKGERGTGLGLAMVYGIAKRHSADIEIESVLSQGTTMRLIFPLPSAPMQSSAPSMLRATSQSRLRILIVDDDPLLIKSLRDILETDGHQIVAANGGQAGIEAFRAAQARHENFEIVITDLGMPYVDGRKVAAAVKGMSPSTPVILLTGWGQRLVAEGDIPQDVDKVINKPPKLHELREALAACQSSAQAHEVPIK
jgi:PAS domain S-box-containing protein